MKTWKLLALILIGAVMMVLVYPGIPVGSNITSVNSGSGRSSKVTCYSLHWNGVHTKVFDLGNALNVSNAACSSF
jgi:hypothetical protein